MDFDPLDLFTPVPTLSANTSVPLHVQEANIASQLDKASGASASTSTVPIVDFKSEENEDFEDEIASMPIHIHDLPLLRCQPPAKVLVSFLRLLSPETSLNFAPSNQSTEKDMEGIDPAAVFAEKNVDVDAQSWQWLQKFCPRFDSPLKLATIPTLAGTLKTAFTAQYNSWLTQLISCDFSWITREDVEEIQTLAALRLAENCGRTAQPEMMRSIEIPLLPTKFMLKEPSLTADNLGLKTWGSSFILGSRLALQRHKNYLQGSVLELGAGTGLVGMVACYLGHHTTLTDLAEIVPNLRDNIELNAVETAVVAELDWSNPEGFLARFGELKFSTVILSDPLYSPQHPQWIVDMVNLFLSRDEDSRVLLQVPVRRNFEQERATLWRLMEENGYIVEEESEELGYDDFGESAFIFRKYVRAKN
ncbi:Lysine methyltransferase [Metschnikowia aff. pulcherrima]|uniref:Lysine methyltransferase n=1 Tax=Metschnikowia aff. pulcherrima TaxID=2163413 RepID=A0A4P6XMI9_9ASCO|nr:Lysine methyltransferase [Metschnikowia aff. pulcherrima]